MNRQVAKSAKKTLKREVSKEIEVIKDILNILKHCYSFNSFAFKCFSIVLNSPSRS
jgi:hypothetical protein